MTVYQPQLLEAQLLEAFEDSKVLLLVSARQVVKNTIFKKTHLLAVASRYATLHYSMA